ncbi:hypothetical protein [Wolbachia endosymbiont of Drosophila ananassae]|uniref:hypothetical protein n=1 Tax=Wolbachia endosymbiont of Drosophila ananassae TaxID=307502 RepID=UPI000EF62DE7|nr:hypothetical protein [Wolbachia endosymbiont of Drosophila ananassae]
MKLAIFFIAFLLSTSCVIAKDGVEPSLEIKINIGVTRGIIQVESFLKVIYNQFLYTKVMS